VEDGDSEYNSVEDKQVGVGLLYSTKLDEILLCSIDDVGLLYTAKLDEVLLCSIDDVGLLYAAKLDEVLLCSIEDAGFSMGSEYTLLQVPNSGWQPLPQYALVEPLSKDQYHVHTTGQSNRQRLTTILVLNSNLPTYHSSSLLHYH
jgi:hypothetical protein